MFLAYASEARGRNVDVIVEPVLCIRVYPHTFQVQIWRDNLNFISSVSQRFEEHIPIVPALSCIYRIYKLQVNYTH